MSGQLSWTREGETLALHGELDQDLLVPLLGGAPRRRRGTAIIDLSQTTRVDTAGLALLVHFVALIRRQGPGSAAGRQERKPANADRSLQPACRSDLIIFSVP